MHISNDVLMDELETFYNEAAKHARRNNQAGFMKSISFSLLILSREAMNRMYERFVAQMDKPQPDPAEEKTHVAKTD